MKKETDWNESTGTRPEAAGSAGASTAVDSLRSPGSFSSTSSDYGRNADADQVGLKQPTTLRDRLYSLLIVVGGQLWIGSVQSDGVDKLCSSIFPNSIRKS